MHGYSADNINMRSTGLNMAPVTQPRAGDPDVTHERPKVAQPRPPMKQESLMPRRCIGFHKDCRGWCPGGAVDQAAGMQVS
ncbi:hypothetical protein BLA18109_01300 [Burkholderia lata]|uniref:Uncharacterized protein n=1 Tax=Burkholderia lata (strain ATCC 17760 / DSM 23089 / LMG 22485 / NCIMB 9086 / R18194 / 383) TaxID=482957 RepID=A0A6P2TR42_BURL3|nr:hypothetical protein BLA18109_01300 [Burkholderia lata]